MFVCDVTTGATHLVGGGPVPHTAARAAARDGFIKAVLHDGVTVDTVVHYGRKKIAAVIRTVLELGDPLDFDGVTCCEPNCDRRYGLEWDHADPVANNGPTSRANLKPRCHDCHETKTEQDRLAGLLGNAITRARGRPP